MGFENKAGLGVNNQYGVRETGGSVGIEHAYGSKVTLKIDLTGQSIADAVAGFMPPLVVPKGALFRSAVLRVDEAFAVSGTSPTVRIGAAGSIGTNGIVLTEAELEAVGTKVPASAGAGTWSQTSSTGTTAAAKVALDLGGTSPVVATTSGKATLILEFVNETKA
jgi:hypothetical protein